MRRLRIRLSLWATLAVVVTAVAVSHGVSASATSCSGDPESSCALVFSAQPGNALLNTNITSNGFDRSGAPAAVEAVETDGGPAAGVTVTLSLLPVGGTATLSGTLSSVTGSDGIATFGSRVVAAGHRSDRLLPAPGVCDRIPVNGIERLPDHQHRTGVLIESVRNLDLRYVQLGLCVGDQRADR